MDKKSSVSLAFVGVTALLISSTALAVTLSQTREICTVSTATGSAGNCTDFHMDVYAESIQFDCLLTKTLNGGASGIQTRYHKDWEANVQSNNSSFSTTAESPYSPGPSDTWCLSNGGEYLDDEGEPIEGQNYQWPPKDYVGPGTP